MQQKISDISQRIYKMKLTANEQAFLFFLFSRVDWTNGLSTSFIHDRTIQEEIDKRYDVINNLRERLAEKGIIRIEPMDKDNYRYTLSVTENQKTNINHVKTNTTHVKTNINHVGFSETTINHGKTTINPGGFSEPAHDHDLSSINNSSSRNNNYYYNIAKSKLLEAGVSKSNIKSLMENYKPEKILQHAELLPFWLEYFRIENPGRTHSPGGILLTAIKNDWADPPGYRDRQKNEARQKVQAETDEHRKQAENNTLLRNLQIYGNMTEAEQREYWQWLKRKFVLSRKALGEYRPLDQVEKSGLGFISGYIDEFTCGRHPP
jgi:hypothetical protein